MKVFFFAVACKMFLCVTKGNGDRERDPCVLMANSQNEMEEWVRAIRRVLGAQSSGGTCVCVMCTYMPTHICTWSHLVRDQYACKCEIANL